MALLNRTGLSSTRFTDWSGLHIRVFYQYTSDNVKESFYDSTIGWNLRGDGSVINAKINTPIAVVSWASGTQIRVYYLDEANYICERAYEGIHWVDGGLRSHNFQAAPFSQLAASCAIQGDVVRLRVYFQQGDGYLQELQYNSGSSWAKSTRALPLATLGSSLSAIGGTASVPEWWWLYYQDPSLKMQGTLTDSSTEPWKQSMYKVPGTFRPGAAISAVGWGDPATESGHEHLRVYVINEANEVIESAYWHDPGWNDGVVIAKATATDSPISAIQWDNGQHIRVYFQRGLAIYESAFEGGRWNGLHGNPIPIYH